MLCATSLRAEPLTNQSSGTIPMERAGFHEYLESRISTPFRTIQSFLTSHRVHFDNSSQLTQRKDWRFRRVHSAPGLLIGQQPRRIKYIYNTEFLKIPTFALSWVSSSYEASNNKYLTLSKVDRVLDRVIGASTFNCWCYSQLWALRYFVDSLINILSLVYIFFFFFLIKIRETSHMLS